MAVTTVVSMRVFPGRAPREKGRGMYGLRVSNSSAPIREASTLPLPQACALSLFCSRPVQAGAPHHESSTLRRGEKDTTPRLSQTGQTHVSRDARARGFSTHVHG